ncbi:hypothetical protein APX70_01766 [Pseudomonas syringae pv. maculicola]|uniref:Uncharacterized protein n=1 Tax=Pseudomonas syringae pv. maculicola TaxID=59511 RepID=A0A3M2TZU7_PSEYM|nr:hypothetical protein APX70_01766 [Pseudomonas syringae pv. maculicola]
MGKGRNGHKIGIRVALRVLPVKGQVCHGALYGLSPESMLKRLGIQASIPVDQ